MIFWWSGMIEHLHIEGFKSLSSLDIELKKMTVLTGLNSTGKSSVIQALRMIFNANDKISPYLNSFGGFKELKSKQMSGVNDDILLEINIGSETASLRLNEDDFNLDSGNFELVYDYVCADRFGPAVILPTLNDKKISVGSQGEYVADYFLKFEDVVVNEKLQHSGSVSTKLEHQLKQWMGEVSPGVSIDFGIDKKHDNSHLEVDGFRATNAGFGISYSLPIVLAALVLTSNNRSNFGNANIQRWYDLVQSTVPVLIVENPEAHLHPQGQTAMGKLLALVASSGVQVIVETHSDHFIDGIRIAAKHSEGVDASDLLIHFFQKDQNGVSVAEQINVLSSGSLDKWPLGFFDQMSTNLRTLSTKRQS
ncbi:MAG: putative ATPase [Cocleimonas sp.]|jgi:predicted ATPase